MKKIDKCSLALAILVGCAMVFGAIPAPIALRDQPNDAPTPIAQFTALAPLTLTPSPTPEKANVIVATPAPTPITPTATPSSQSPSTNNLIVRVTKVADKFTRPVYVTFAAKNNDADRLYVIEQPGRILVIENNATRQTPFLDITDRVGSNSNEQGLLGLAFSPNYTTDGAFWVNYTDKQGNTTIAKFSANTQSAIGDANSEQKILIIDQPFANHNGGMIEFGRDGYLYIATGDGGSQGDPQGHAQNKKSLLGKILRINVLAVPDGKAYGMPADNPFANDEGGREIWAWGLRNPWRFSFDRANGDLYIGDVGQNSYEELNYQPANTKGGENYGWNVREGFEPYRSGENRSEFFAPIYAYGRSEGCSVTGGYVYRGKRLSDLLDGTYLYADYCRGTIWGLRRDSGGVWQNIELLKTDFRISSFGEDAIGEVYVVDHSGGAVYRIAD